MKRGIFILIATMCFLTACGDDSSDPTSTIPTTLNTISVTSTGNEIFSDRDYEVGYTESESVIIEFDGSTITASDDSVVIDGTTVSISAEGTYILSGTLDDGQVLIEADSETKIQLVLDNVNISNSTSAAIYVVSADKVFITMESGSVNTLSATPIEDETAETNVDAVIFSKADLTLNGEGTLNVYGTESNGITSKDELTIASGTYNIYAGNHGLEANDSIAIAHGTFYIESGKDGLHAEHDEDETLGFIYVVEGTFNIISAGDGMDASSTVEILNGTYDIVAGGGYVSASSTSSGSSTMNNSMNNMTNMTQSPGRISNSNEGELFATSLAGNSNQGGSSNQQQNNMMDIPTGMEDNMQMMDIPSDAEIPEMTIPEDTMMMDMQDFTVTSADDVDSSKAIKADVGIIIYDGTFNLDAVDDTIHSNINVEITGGTFNIASGDDAIHAEVALDITGGDFVITTCYEGLEGQQITVSGGTFDIYAEDDGLNATRSDIDSSDIFIKVSGGTFTIDVNNEGDGIDSNGSIELSGGSMIVEGTTTVTDTPLDYSGSSFITGGTFIATGSYSQTLQNFGSDYSTQCSLLVIMSQSQTGDVTLTDSDGNVIVSISPSKAYYSIHISTPELELGETYYLTAGTYTETITFDSYIYGETSYSEPSFGNNMTQNRK